MPKIIIKPHSEICPKGAEIEAEKGSSLCEAMLDNKINIEHACELSCACTTCHVIVTSGFDKLNEASEDEEVLDLISLKVLFTSRICFFISSVFFKKYTTDLKISFGLHSP